MTKSVLIYSDRPDPPWRYVSWWLHDPLVLSEEAVTSETRVVTPEGKQSYPDLSEEVLSPHDLVVGSPGTELEFAL